MNKIAFFDFDGTITKGDTLALFIKYYVGSFNYYLSLFALSPIIIAFKLKILNNSKAKKIVLRHFFYGVHEDEFNDKAKKFSLEEIPKVIRPKALQEIEKFIGEGTKVVIVSASLENWLKPWCDSLGVELISTKVDFINGYFNGEYVPANCYGEEKVTRIRESYNLELFNEIYAYGDSSGDLPMLELANNKFYKPFL